MTARAKAITPMNISSMNIHRQPMDWMMKPPTATPTTGPPAPTNDHHPMALTRSPLGKAPSTRAIEVAPNVAPTNPPRTRAAMSTPTVGAVAESRATPRFTARAAR